jgi:acyl carrier protein
MGMEVVELVMELEDTFQMHIVDEDAASLRTIGDIHKLIMKMLERPEGVTGCLSAHAFYKLRRAMVECLHRDRASIRPAVALAAMLPRENRWAMLNALEGATGLKMPKLVRPGWMEMSNFYLMLACGLAAAIWAGLHFSFGAGVIAFFTAMIAIGVLLEMATLPWKREIHRATTFGDLVERVRDRNFLRLAESAHQFQEREVWTAIVTLTADQFGVNEEEIKPETRLVEDLHVG